MDGFRLFLFESMVTIYNLPHINYDYRVPRCQGRRIQLFYEVLRKYPPPHPKKKLDNDLDKALLESRIEMDHRLARFFCKKINLQIDDFSNALLLPSKTQPLDAMAQPLVWFIMYIIFFSTIVFHNDLFISQVITQLLYQKGPCNFL